MTTPAYQIRLHDLRQLVGGLVDPGLARHAGSPHPR